MGYYVVFMKSTTVLMDRDGCFPGKTSVVSAMILISWNWVRLPSGEGLAGRVKVR